MSDDPVVPVLARFGRGVRAGIQPGLDAIRAAARHLGDPQNRLPPTVHVTGTNGKGSTVALLVAMAEAAGLRVHRFTSPPLHRWSECVVPAGGPLSDTALADAATHLLDQELPPLSPFEAVTLLALHLFSDRPADLAVIEVGMGGALDATNLLTTTRLSLFTPIGLDHQAFLGPGLTQIARAKAGILRPGRPALSVPQAPAAQAVLTAEAARLGARLRVLDAAQIARAPLPPGLPGEHQRLNAALALAAAEVLAEDFPGLDAAARAQGLRRARLSGRLTRRDLGRGRTLWLDAAHNAEGLAALAAWVAAQPGPLDLVIGLLADRDPALALPVIAARPMIADLAAGRGRVLTVDAVDAVRPERNRTAAELCQALAALGVEASPTTPALVLADRDGRSLLATGSFTVVGALLAALETRATLDPSDPDAGAGMAGDRDAGAGMAGDPDADAGMAGDRDTGGLKVGAGRVGDQQAG